MSFGKHNLFVYAAAWVLILIIWFLKSFYSPVFNGHVSAYKKPGQTLKKLSSNSVFISLSRAQRHVILMATIIISSVILLLVLAIQIKETGGLCCYTSCTDNFSVIEIVMMNRGPVQTS